MPDDIAADQIMIWFTADLTKLTTGGGGGRPGVDLGEVAARTGGMPRGERGGGLAESPPDRRG